MFKFSPKFLDDAGAFKVEARWLPELANAELQPPGARLGHSNTPILYRVNSGALVQVGPDTFRVCPHTGPIWPQGNPWEPTIVAYNLGDATCRPTEHPAHVNVNILNSEGRDQTLEFAPILDQKVASLRPIKLHPKASSGLPVQFLWCPALPKSREIR